MKLKITVHGVAYEVEVEVLDPGEGFAPAAPLPSVRPSGRSSSGSSPAPAPQRPGPPSSAPATQGGESARSVASPIAGTVVEVKCSTGDTVQQGQVLLVIEAMKMNTSIAAPAEGKIRTINVAAGDSVREGQVLIEFGD
jgi:biotin carboxyl carrier protein